MYVEMDDFRQSYVVAVNEIRKFIRGKKFLVYGLLVVLAFALFVILPFASGQGFHDFYQIDHVIIPAGIVPAFLSFMNIIVILGATLFASNVLVSEFEDRTALVLFTRPVKRTSIFIGKIIGCIVIETVVIVIYYLAIAVVSQAADGFVPTELFVSLGITFMYIVAASGVAILISSIMKRSGTSAVLTFFSLLLIIPIVSLIFMIAFGDAWYILNIAASTLAPTFADGVYFPIVNVARTCGVMFVWGIVSMVLSWMIFVKREF